MESWSCEREIYEVNSYDFEDCWCYELFEVGQDTTENNYIDVRIPDVQPANGPLVPAAAEQVTFTVHGSLTLPWLVLHHFLSAIVASGDIVGEPAAEPG